MEGGLIFFILSFPLVSLIGKTSLSLLSAIVWVGEVCYYSFLIFYSKNLGCSPRGSSNFRVGREGSLQSLKKSEG